MPDYAYDLTLKPAIGQYKPQYIAATFKPVMIDGLLVYTLPDGTTVFRVLNTEPTIFEVEQVQSASAPTSAQLTGTYRDLATAFISQGGSNAQRGNGLDEKVTIANSLWFNVTIETITGSHFLQDVKALEIEAGVLRLRANQAGVYRNFNLSAGGVRQIEVVPT